jgi:hypothetical protein
MDTYRYRCSRCGKGIDVPEYWVGGRACCSQACASADVDDNLKAQVDADLKRITVTLDAGDWRTVRVALLHHARWQEDNSRIEASNRVFGLFAQIAEQCQKQEGD